MTIAFDCDGTLYDWTQDEKPRWDILAMLRTLSEKHTVIVWSGGGKEYAAMKVRKMNIQPFVSACYSKTSAPELDVDLCFDDENVRLAKINIQV